MSLKVKYDRKEDIPQGLEKFFTEKDGAWFLQAEGMKTDADIESVKGALEKERKVRRDAENNLKTLQDRFTGLPDDFDAAEYHRLKDMDGGKVDEKLREQRERLTAAHQKELDKVKEELGKQTSTVHNLVARQGLAKAMAEAGIAEPLREAVEAMYLPKVKIEDAGGEIQALLDNKPLADAMQEFAQSDKGKHYVAADKSGGGGSHEAGGGGNVKTVTRAQWDGMNHVARSKFAKDGGKVVDT